MIFYCVSTDYFTFPKDPVKVLLTTALTDLNTPVGVIELPGVKECGWVTCNLFTKHLLIFPKHHRLV